MPKAIYFDSVCDLSQQGSYQLCYTHSVWQCYAISISDSQMWYWIASYYRRRLIPNVLIPLIRNPKWVVTAINYDVSFRIRYFTFCVKSDLASSIWHKPEHHSFELCCLFELSLCLASSPFGSRNGCSWFLGKTSSWKNAEKSLLLFNM